MAYEFKLPDIGEGVVEGEIVKWLVNEGDEVDEDQPLVEVMTDKATVTIPSPKKGKVVKRIGEEGAIAKVHEPLVVMEVAGGAPEKTEEPKTAAPQPEAKAPAGPAPAAERAPAPRPDGPPAAAGEKILATPVTRRIAGEYGVDLSRVTGTGPQGRVLKKDVLAVIEGGRAAEAPREAPPPAAPPAAPAAVAGDERMPIRGLRRAIFKKMTQSAQYAVPFTYVDEVDVTELVTLRKRVNERLKKEGGRMTFLPFIIKALVAALRKYPHLNAVMDEEKQELVIRKAYNIGIGVATDAGLTVAVIHEADRRSLRGLAEELDRLGNAARDGKLTQQELTGSTFTITSLGREGGILATPVINHPEVAILGIHRIEPRAVVIDREIVVRDRMNLSCSFDHRIIDGHVGAAFVTEVIRYLQDPELLMLEMT